MKSISLIALVLVTLIQGLWIAVRDSMILSPTHLDIASTAAFLLFVVCLAFLGRYPLIPIAGVWIFVFVFSILLYPESFNKSVAGFVVGNATAFLLVGLVHLNVFLRKTEHAEVR